MVIWKRKGTFSTAKWVFVLPLGIAHLFDPEDPQMLNILALCNKITFELSQIKLIYKMSVSKTIRFILLNGFLTLSLLKYNQWLE